VDASGIKEVVEILIVLAVWIGRAIQKANQQKRQPPPPSPTGPRPQRAPAPTRTAPVPGRTPRAPLPGGRPSSAAPPRPPAAPSLAQSANQLAARLEADAAALDERLERERLTRRFLPVLRDWLPPRLRELRQAAAAGRLDAAGLDRAVSQLAFVLDQLERMAAERLDAVLGAALADADALASACYDPVIDWTRATNLPLRAAVPAVRLGGVELAVWTGLQPTGLAPIFLPRSFFERAAWWPALAHEIGHSFLASVDGLDGRLRGELGLPGEAQGARPLDIAQGGVTRHELQRVFGGWFEELFCDVFGTLMCGPGYTRAMFTLFAAQDDPREVLAVAVDPSGTRYDVHPPRYLRLIASCRTLERAGLDEDAAALRAEWDARHLLDGAAPDRILYPIGARHLSVPLPPIEELVASLVDRLVDGPLDALDGEGLADVGGLGYGPHEHQDALRAREALLGGRVPSVRDVRAVVAGLVLAAAANPNAEAALLARARAAIPGRDSGEVRPDAYAQPASQVVPVLPGAPRAARTAARPPVRSILPSLARPSRALVREALVARAILGAPVAVARRRPGARRP
jgi:hypothetical protein